jgi:hypothetical protein
MTDEFVSSHTSTKPTEPTTANPPSPRVQCTPLELLTILYNNALHPFPTTRERESEEFLYGVFCILYIVFYILRYVQVPR